MATYRIVKTRNFTQIPNDTLRDQKLSLKAKGLLCMLLSHDDGFHITADDIVAMVQEGKHAVRAAMVELRDAGYVVNKRVQDKETGHWGWDVEIYDTPNTRFSDIRIIRRSDNPTFGKSGTDININRDIEKEEYQRENNAHAHADKETTDWMEDVTREVTMLPAVSLGWKDLQIAKLVRCSRTQDEIDTQCLIDAHGFETVRKAAESLRKGQTMPAYPSAIKVALEGKTFNRGACLKELVRRLREKWSIPNTTSNDFLTKCIECGNGLAAQLRKCQTHHGHITTDWLLQSEKDLSITFGDPRTDEQLAAMLDSSTQKGKE